MNIPSVAFRSQVRTVSSGLPSRIARDALDSINRLETLTHPNDITAGVIEMCDCLTDAVRATAALDQALETLHDIRRALDDEDLIEAREPAREARDLRIRMKAIARIAPDVDQPEIRDLRTEVVNAIDKVKDACTTSHAIVLKACLFSTWILPKALRDCDDVGLALRSMARAGLLPPEIDRHLAFGPVADRNAPDGSPRRNSADALEIVTSTEAGAMRDRGEQERRASEALSARILEVVTDAMEAA